jgi:hypothetical protein
MPKRWVSFDKSARILALLEEKSARAKIYPSHLTVNGVESLHLKRIGWMFLKQKSRSPNPKNRN